MESNEEKREKAGGPGAAGLRARLAELEAENADLRRQAAELRAAEEAYRSLVERVPGVTYIAAGDAWAPSYYISPQIEDLLGWPREEFLSGPDFWLSKLHPDDREQAHQAWLHSLKTGTPYAAEYRMIARDGRGVWFHDEAAYVPPRREGERPTLHGVMMDITAKKRAEEALRAERDLVRNVLECSPDPILITDRDDVVRDCNPAALQMAGIAVKEDIIGRSAFDFIAEDLTPLAREVRQEVLRKGVLRGIEIELVAPDGRRFPVEASVALLRRADTLHTGFVFVLTDIAERKRMEEALRESEARYRSLFDTMALGVVYQDAEGHITTANRAAERILGLTLDQMQGRTSVDPRWRAVRADGSDFPGEEHPSMVALRTGEVVRNVVMGVFNPHEDEYRWININAVPQFRPGEDRPHEVFTTFEDITERKRMEEALRESEARYRSLFDTMALGVVYQDAEGHITTANRAAERILGLTPEQMKGRTSLDSRWSAVREDGSDFPGEEHPIVVALREGRPVTGVVMGVFMGVFNPRLGEYRWIEISAVPQFRPGEDRPHGAFAVFEDVTERKRAERTLRESEEKYRTLFEQARNPILIVDEDGVYVDANEAALKFLETAHEELLGRSVWDFAPPEQHERTMAAHPPFMGRRTQETEFLINGRIKTLMLNVVPLTVAGRRMLYGIGQDVTDRKRVEEALRESEARYHALFDNAADAIFIHDLEGRFLEVNRVACERLGYSREELLQMGPADIDAPEYAARVPERLNTLLKSGFAFFETTHMARGGRTVPTELSSRLIEYGGRPAVLSIARDVSERQRLEDQLRQSQKMEAIGTLAGGVAHDFNNLLTAIRGYTDFLLSSLSKDDPRYQDVEGIGRAAERATALTRQLLAFSRRQVQQPKVLDLNDVVRGLLKMLGRMIGEDIDLAADLAPDLRSVRFDPGQLEQVIMNLAVNAREAMPQGGKLTIRTENVHLDEEYVRQHVEVVPGHYVRLCVSDTGVGMDGETLQRIFDPFFTTKEMGSGLGLATVYGIVKQSGGHIRVYSEVGEGTVFKVYFPAVVDVDTAAQREAGAPAPVPHGSETVLLVEDEEWVRRLARRALEQNGYHVLEAPHGRDALRLAREHEGGIDLLITDVVMPGQLSGRDVAEQLQAARPGLKVIYISGYTDDAIVRHGILHDRIDFVEKPFTPSSLLRKVREALDRP